MDVADVVAADVVAELPDRLEEREDLDVADRAADLGDDDVDVVGGQAVDAALDLVGDVRDHLHGLAEVVAAALGGEHRLVDRAGRGVRVPRQVLVDEALVVAEVEVGLAAVVGDEHLAVLERVHRARVDVDVRVELLHRDPQAPGLEQPAERGGGEALAEGAGHATRHEDVLRHGRWTVASPDRDRADPARESPPPPVTDASPAPADVPDRAALVRAGHHPAGPPLARCADPGAAPPDLLRHQAPDLRRRRLRRLGGGHAQRRRALPGRLLQPGPPLPAPGLDRRHPGPAHPRRAPPARPRVRPRLGHRDLPRGPRAGRDHRRPHRRRPGGGDRQQHRRHRLHRRRRAGDGPGLDRSAHRPALPARPLDRSGGRHGRGPRRGHHGQGPGPAGGGPRGPDPALGPPAQGLVRGSGEPRSRWAPGCRSCGASPTSGTSR